LLAYTTTLHAQVSLILQNWEATCGISSKDFTSKMTHTNKLFHSSTQSCKTIVS